MSKDMDVSNDVESDDDWFNKDEEELLKDLKIKVEEAKHKLEKTTEERIEPAVSCDVKSIIEWRLEAAAKRPQDLPPKISTADIRKLTESENALEAFLYAFTQENPDFFLKQIHANDAMERVLLYTRAYVMIAELKAPGFHKTIMKEFTKNEELLVQIQFIITKMFTKSYISLWKTDGDKARLDRFISDIQFLFLQVYKLNMLTPKVITTMQHIKRLLKIADSKEIINRTVCLEFAQNLLEILTADDNDGEETKAIIKPPNEIYPNLNELLAAEMPIDNALSLATHVYKSTIEYLEIQRNALRDDFVSVLSYCVKELKETKRLSPSLAGQVILYENVEIVLNEKFVTAQRQEMLFVNIIPDCVDQHTLSIIGSQLKELKNGSLVCFTTSYDFDDLILAVVTFQQTDYGKSGYLAIEIVRQYNIGNIYNKKLIMFSSPAFFEPYRNVYNYLNTCSVDDFPMKELIVFGKPYNSSPSYLTNETVYTTENCKFKPLHEEPPKSLPLNDSQREALQMALTQKFSLIQGPPGTGKTHLTVQLVKLLLENKTPKPIVVVAYTNESLDKFLIKISAYTTSIARLGAQTRSSKIEMFTVQNPDNSELLHPRLKRLYFNVKTKFTEAFTQLQAAQKEFDGTDDGYEKVLLAQRKVRTLTEQLNTIRLLFRYYAVREHSIVALTTTCAAKMNFLFRLLKSQIVIFEEAAEILESHVLSTLTPFTEHVIMVGDQKQLKPYTSNYKHSRSLELNVSLFERLINLNILKPAVLLTQYRMRPEIAELMCPIFYDVLYNDGGVAEYPNIRGMQTNLFFVTHNELETQIERKTSVCNKYEILKIVELAKYLLKKSGYKPEEIVILSPYAGQCDAFREHKTKQCIRVMTVDSFQGLEAKIVLLSLVRSNNQGQIGFLKEKNRVCVALSRAKHGLYIIGNLGLLARSSKTWTDIQEKLKSHNLIGETFPFQKKVGTVKPTKKLGTSQQKK